MPQCIHILKKDIRYLQREIFSLLVLFVVFTWAEVREIPNRDVLSLLIVIASAYLLTRVIHAEAIPGDQQFWITRPYRWPSLLAAKLLFMLCFLMLPLFAAQLAIVGASGFSFKGTIPSLMWVEFLFFVVTLMPLSAIASVTSNTNALFYWLIGWISLVAIGGQLVTPWRSWIWPMDTEWIRNSVAVVIAGVCAGTVVLQQYRSRSTVLSRTFAIGAAVIGLAVYSTLPWHVIWATQSGLLGEGKLSSGLKVSFDRSSNRSPSLGRNPAEVGLGIPLIAEGIPPGTELQAELVHIDMVGPGGEHWTSVGSIGHDLKLPVNTFEGLVSMPHERFAEWSNSTVDVRGTAYLTLLGNTSTTQIHLSESPRRVRDGLVCSLNFADATFYTTRPGRPEISHNVICRAEREWRWKVEAGDQQTGMQLLNSSFSYSPFPAELNLNPIITHFVPASNGISGETTFTFREPVAHFTRDFSAQGVRLADLSAVNNLR